MVGLSDNAPVSSNMRPKLSSDFPQRLPRWIALHPSYPQVLNDTFAEFPKVSSSPFVALEQVKIIIRKAAMKIRNDNA